MNFLNPSASLFLIPLLILWGLYSPRYWLRLALIITIVFAMVQPVIQCQQPSRYITLLVDRSLSTRGEAITQARALANTISRQSLVQLNIIGFGRGAQRLATPQTPIENDHLELQDESNLHAGLSLALGLAAGLQQPQSLLVLSDGQWTGTDPRTLIPELREKQIKIHYAPLSTATATADYAITRLFYPAQVAVNQPFTIIAEITAPPINANTTPQAQIAFFSPPNPQPLAQETLSLKGGTQFVRFAWRIPTPGVQRYQLELKVEGVPEKIPENNIAQLAVEAQSAPRLLLINPKGQRTALAKALESTGLTLDIRLPEQQPLHSATLRPYSIVVLENQPLDQLNETADQALQQWITQFGGGLLITGGRQSYAMGGYYHSALEPLLPVTLERQQELRRPKLAVGIILDRSGSMAATIADGTPKMALANRAAVESLTLLTPEDELCVMAVDTQAHVVVSLQAIGSGPVQEAIAQRILSIESQGGGIFVYEGLRQMAACLLKSTAPNRHIILFADAADAEEPGESADLIQTWRQLGGSLSVIGLGTEKDADAELLKSLAQQGNGRAFFTHDPQALPRIFAQDMIQVARNTFIEQTTAIQTAAGFSTLNKGLSLPIPAVNGYNLTYLAPQASLILTSDDTHHAPLAASWQRGAGKVLALLFEADGPHTGPFAHWADYAAWFRNSIEWLKAPPMPVEYYANLSLRGRQAEVTLEFTPGTPLPNPPQAFILTPEEQLLVLPLHWQGQDQMTATFELTQTGIYHGVIPVPNPTANLTPLTPEGQFPWQPLTLPPRILPYSPEFNPAVSNANHPRVLPELAQATGGQLFTHTDTLVQNTAFTALQPTPLAPFFWGLSLLLILLEIGWRRGIWPLYLRRILKPFLPWLQPIQQKIMAYMIRQQQKIQKTPSPATPPAISAKAPSPPLASTPDPLAIAKHNAQKKRL